MLFLLSLMLIGFECQDQGSSNISSYNNPSVLPCCILNILESSDISIYCQAEKKKEEKIIEGKREKRKEKKGKKKGKIRKKKG